MSELLVKNAPIHYAAARDCDDLLGEPAPRGLALTGRNLQRGFQGREVLRRIDLHVPAGQFVAIIGRSGCGKSTLLRLLAGLDKPDGGHISYGAAAQDQKAAHESVRMMFQEPRLLPWARVIDNVAVGLGPKRAAPGASERVEQALKAVGLASRAQDWPSVLSGGQRQRVALARALVSRPRALTLDEPLGALDALTRVTMQRLIETLWLEQQFTAILVTHDVGEALALADRVVMIENGAIALDLAVALPRPRRRGLAEFAAFEERILDALLGEPAAREASP